MREKGRGMNSHDEADIDNLPFEGYARVMAERGAAEADLVFLARYTASR